MAIMVNKGYAGFRTAEAAEAAGVSRGAMTHHFPSKDDLVVALVEHVFEKSAELGRKRVRDFGSVDEVIAELISDSREFFFSELFLIAMDLAIQGRMGNARLGGVQAVSATSRLSVEESWLNALVAVGIPVSVAEDLLWLTLSIVRGLAVRRLWQVDPSRFNRLFRLWREMVVVYLDNLPKVSSEESAPNKKPPMPSS